MGNVATGFIAIGNVARGFIAIGNLAIGVIAIGPRGRAETVEASLADLAQRLRVPITKAVDANVNVEPGQDLKYLDRYDRATLEFVNTLYREDFERFGYPMIDPRDVPVRAVR